MKGGFKIMKLNNKRGQQDIIVTVLLVLIAIIAVAIVATFILRQVRQGAGSAESQANCIKLDFDITSAVNGETTIDIARNDESSVAIQDYRVSYDDDDEDIAPVTTKTARGTESLTLTIGPLATGKTVEAIAILDDGTICPNKANKVVTAL